MRKDIVKQPGLGNQIKTNSCMECNNYTRSFRSFRGQYLCYKCYSKKITIIQSGRKLGITLKQALDKIYEPRTYISKKGRIQSVISIPQILIGHKFKFVLIE